MSKERASIPENINREYLSGLLKIVEQRYDQLIAVGAYECIPGQMLYVVRGYRLVKYEIDGNLFLDAQKNLIKTLKSLDHVRRMVEERGSSDNCFKSFRLGHFSASISEKNPTITPELPDWSDSIEIRNLMRNQW